MQVFLAVSAILNVFDRNEVNGHGGNCQPRREK
jgi:hypothetical protein